MTNRLRLLNYLRAAFNNIIYKHSHSIITLSIMLLSLLLGVELYVGLLLIGFWVGREHSQAEYRYMKLKDFNQNYKEENK